ncbi:MAG: hypothetical protein EBX41_08025, partial [Chitinophagia bacterium]|nr:hypothetical protein [Chitinophagia bacterium]
MNKAYVLIATKNFALPLGVTLHTLNKLQTKYDVVVLYDEYFNELDLYKNKFKLNLIFKKIDIDVYKEIKFSNPSRVWDYNPAFRFEIFKLNYDKIIYLDLDILIKKSLDELFELEGDFYACELHNLTNKYYTLGNQKGFNAGLLVIGKKYLNDNVFNSLLDISKKNTYTGNQKILNEYFDDKVSFLEIKYNLTTDFLTLENLKTAYMIH